MASLPSPLLARRLVQRLWYTGTLSHAKRAKNTICPLKTSASRDAHGNDNLEPFQLVKDHGHIGTQWLADLLRECHALQPI